MSLLDDLSDKLDTLLEYYDDPDLDEYGGVDRIRLVSELTVCAAMADELEIIEVRCFRCDRPFRSLPDVKYCTKECELGGVAMPYQTREVGTEPLNIGGHFNVIPEGTEVNVSNEDRLLHNLWAVVSRGNYGDFQDMYGWEIGRQIPSGGHPVWQYLRSLPKPPDVSDCPQELKDWLVKHK